MLFGSFWAYSTAPNRHQTPWEEIPTWIIGSGWCPDWTTRPLGFCPWPLVQKMGLQHSGSKRSSLHVRPGRLQQLDVPRTCLEGLSENSSTVVPLVNDHVSILCLLRIAINDDNYGTLYTSFSYM